MALRLSTGLRNFLNEAGGLKQALNNGKMMIYSGAQPASADDAASGTLLATITKASGALTEEVQASGTVTLTGGASGSVDTLTVNSLEIMGAAVPFNTSLTQTATDVATAINNNPQNLLFVASAAAAVVTIKAKPGLGALANGWVVASTGTTITTSDVNLASGVTAVNGLTFGDASAGQLVKNPAETWTGLGVAAGTAGWFRYEGAVADTEGSDTAELYIRLDGNIATSGANLNMSSTGVAVGATQTISTFSLTVPAA
jgi:hypothetical protein